MKCILRVIGAGLVCLAVSFGQESSRFTFDVGAGFAPTVGTTGRQLNNEGFSLGAGAGYNFLPWLGVKVDLGYESFQVNTFQLNNLGVPNGSMNVFSATLDPVVRLKSIGHFDFYVTGGGGIFHQHQDFGQPSNGGVTGVDSFFGFNPGVTNSIANSSYSVNRPGTDVGAGITIKTNSRGKFFAEAKYDRIYFNNYHMDFLPVTFGYRW